MDLPVDTHYFTISRYKDDSVDISCSRVDFEVDEKLACREAYILTRCLNETLLEDDETFSVHVYDSGSTTSLFKDDSGFCDTWKRFRWVKERLHMAAYSGILGYPRPPRWLCYSLWVIEWLIASTLRRFKNPHVITEPVEQPTSAEVVEPLPSNVVVFKPRA